MVGPTGTVINELCKGTFSPKLGEVALEVEAIVADITDVGSWELMCHKMENGGPTDLLLSKGVLQLQVEEVPIIQVGLKNRVQRFTTDYTITPAQAKAVIRRVFTERHDYGEISTEFERKPTDHCSEAYPLRMAATIGEFNQDHSCKDGSSNTVSNDKVLKEADSSEKKSTDSMSKGIDIMKVERVVFKDNAVANSSQRVNEISTVKQRNLLCGAMSGIATVNEAKQSHLVGLDIRPVLPANAAGLETNIDETVTISPTGLLGCAGLLLWNGEESYRTPGSQEDENEYSDAVLLVCPQGRCDDGSEEV